LLNASQIGFRAHHSTTLHCMRLADHVTLNVYSNISTAAVFLDVEKSFDTTWQPGLLYKFSKLQFSTSLIKLIGSFLSQRKFRVTVEGEMSTPRYMQAGVPQGSVLSPTLYNLYTNDTHLALFADDICLYATERSSVGSTLFRPGVNTGILKSMKKRLGRSTSLIEIDRLILLLR
jgi:hypothetical protein